MNLDKIVYVLARIDTGDISGWRISNSYNQAVELLQQLNRLDIDISNLTITNVTIQQLHDARGHYA